MFSFLQDWSSEINLKVHVVLTEYFKKLSLSLSATMCNVFLLQKVICEFLLLIFVYFGFTNFYYGNFQNTQKENKQLKEPLFC